MRICLGRLENLLEERDVKRPFRASKRPSGPHCFLFFGAVGSPLLLWTDPIKAKMQRMMQAFAANDTSGNGTLDFDEFCNLLLKAHPEQIWNLQD